MRRLWRRGWVSACMVWFGAVMTPTIVWAEHVADNGVHHDVAYGEHERQRFDWYPVPGASEPTPVVIYYHGGGFVRGDKDQVSRRMIRRLQARGIGVASVNYRLADQAFLPAPMYDGARAVQFLRHHADRFGLDPEAVAVSGTSAGAGIALWVAFADDRARPGSDDLVLRESSRVSAVWVLDAQVSYDPAFWESRGLGGVVTDGKVRDLFGDMDGFAKFAVMSLIREASPITHVSAGDPPVRLDYRGSMGVTRSTSASALLHHPLHGSAFLEACQRVDVPCELYYDGGPESRESVVDFLAGRLVEPEARGSHER
ncbi:MAG: alpha/beta hydrolase [Planctomycetota bacterium]